MKVYATKKASGSYKVELSNGKSFIENDMQIIDDIHTMKIGETDFLHFESVEEIMEYCTQKAK